MAKNTAKVTVNVINEAQSTSLPPVGIAFAMGETEFGIPNDPSALITSVSQYEKNFGGVLPTKDFSLQAEQAIQNGASLRICRIMGVGHAGASDNVASDAPVDMFTVTTKGHGAWYNDIDNIKVQVTAPSSVGLLLADGYFNLLVEDFGSGITELFEDLLFEPGPIAGSTYMKEVIDTSRLIDITYLDTTAALLPQVAQTLTLAGGDDGAALILGDFAGTQAGQTGVYAFDQYYDGNMLAAMAHTFTTLEMYGVGATYAALRKDMVWTDHLPLATNTSSAIAALLATLSTNKYALMLTGGVKVTDLVNGGVKSMTGTGMVLGAIATAQNLYGPWRSPTAYAAGNLPAALGVVTNWGSPASEGERNTIANSGGNCIVSKSQQIMLWDAYSMALGNSPEKFFSVVQLEIYMVDVLKPILESYLGLPNIWGTWERIYYTVLPFLESLVQDEALYEYKWDGDQFATSLDDLQINDATEVGQGIYKIQLQIKTVVPIVEITLNIVLTETSVEFS